MYAASARKGVKIPVKPSCSLKFYVQHKEGENSGYRMLPPEEKERKFKACYFEVHCDESKEAYFDCGSAGSEVAVLQSHMCWGLCKSSTAKGWIDTDCDSWVRRPAKKKGWGPRPP